MFSNTETFIDPYSEYGMLRSSSADKTVWLWATIPWSAPLLDGGSDRDRRNANDEFAQLFDNLAKEVSISGMRYRNLLKDQYRSFHILAGSTPLRFQAAPKMRNTDLGRWQNLMYSKVRTRRQFAYIGIPLRAGGSDDSDGARRPGPWARFVTTLDRYAYSISNGAPDFEEYLPDMHRIERMMLGAGLRPFSLMDDDEFTENVAIMKSWWMSYRQSSALPVIPESDHLHLFPDPEAAASAEKMYEQGKSCRDWNIMGELPATVCFAQSSRFSRNLITDSSNLWVARLLAVSQAGGGNAIGVSIRGKVEPAEITANEIRRNSQTINDSIRERFEHNREASGDMQDLKERLDYKKSIYQHQDMPPTIIDLSVAALVAGRARQALDALSSIPDITFVAMNTPYEQLMGFKSMCPCSPVTVIPYTLHWSSTVVSGAGISSFEQGGDGEGALLGLSEKNRQMILVNTTTVQDKDMRPFFVIIGDTGSGKALTLSTPLPVPPQRHFPAGGMRRLGDLKEGDFVYGRDGEAYPILKLHPVNTDDVYRVTLSDGQTIETSGDHLWVVSSFKDRKEELDGDSATRRRESVASMQASLMSAAQNRMEGDLATADMLASLVGPVIPDWMGEHIDAEKMERVMSFMNVSPSVDGPDGPSYDVREALSAFRRWMGMRYEPILSGKPSAHMEKVITTRDMLAAGLKDRSGHDMWAIHAPSPIKGRRISLPVDPWLLGAWIASGAPESGTFLITAEPDDVEYLHRHATDCGARVESTPDGTIVDLGGSIAESFFVYGGGIPERYFNASVEQRLELARGLMDVNGVIHTDGGMSYEQEDACPATLDSVARLLRSLGIVVGYKPDASSGEGGEHARSIRFSTDLPVISRPSGKLLLSGTTRHVDEWVYVTDIERIADQPHRCLTVGSPDHTFLVAGYVPTHNTMAAFNLMLQWSMIDARDGSGKTPCIFINPKSGNDLEDAVRSQGGVVMRMDSDLADGIFDPFKVMDDVERAKEMATIMIADILDPKGVDVNMELTVASMIDFGVKRGARCCGVALGLAAKAVRDKTRSGGTAADIGLPENTMDVYRKVIGAIRTYQSMRLLFGTKNDSMSLRVSNTLTLINAGKRSLIPEQDSGDTVTGRIQQWLLRMTVLGAGTAVQGRDGMVVLDEAWVAMGKGKGSSKTLEEWTRMARSKRFTPVLCTQKVQEFIDSGLTGGISRALLLSLDDPDESDGNPSPARQAMRLLQIDDKSGRMKYRMSQGATKNNGKPNANSLKTLRIENKETGKKVTVRGAVGYWIDNRKPPIPVEIVIPPALLKQISTTATDVIARQQEARRRLGGNIRKEQ